MAGKEGEGADGAEPLGVGRHLEIGEERYFWHFTQCVSDGAAPHKMHR